MKFKNNLIGTFLLGVVFVLFMLVVSILFILVLVPVFLVEFAVIFVGGGSSIAGIFTGIMGLLILLASFVMVGWAVFYFYKKNTFVYKKRKRR